MLAARLSSPSSTPFPIPCVPRLFIGDKTAGGKVNTLPTSVVKIIMSGALPLLSLHGVNRGKLHFPYKTGFVNLIYLHSNKGSGSFYSELVSGFIVWFQDQSYNVQVESFKYSR
jgi:hypothetical protein